MLAVEKFTGNIWEPACGDGRMSDVLLGAGYTVASTDLYDRGYGTAGIDFLMQSHVVDNIVTNPPFKLAEEFVTRALRLARRKVAIFCRLAWLEGQGRYERIYSVTPPVRVHVFARRVAMTRGGDPTLGANGAGGMMPFCWIVWDRAHVGPTELKWLSPFKKE